MDAAKKNFSPEKYYELEHCDSARKVLETVTTA